MDRTARDGLPIACHADGCRASVAWQVVWIGDPALFRLTCVTHIGAALQQGERNFLLPYPFATPGAADLPS